jgi:hypothetical protein
MKKSKFLVLGLIALMLAGGLVLASCSACPGIAGVDKGKCNFDYKNAAAFGTLKNCENNCLGNQIIEDGKDGVNPIGKSYSCDC